MELRHIVLLGAGNLATQIGLQFKVSGIAVVQVYNRTKSRAENLATLLGCKAAGDLKEIRRDADLYLLAVSDSAIVPLASRLSEVLDGGKGFVVHTSGATPASALEPFFRQFGVLYPLQTFTAGRTADFSQIPVCITGSSDVEAEALEQLARQISPKLVRMNDHQRLALHVAAVFANNFTNHLYDIAFQIALNNSLDPDLLRPLIRETSSKIMDQAPHDMQTGPARRGDAETIRIHLKFLQEYSGYSELYDILSNSIQKSYT